MDFKKIPILAYIILSCCAFSLQAEAISGTGPIAVEKSRDAYYIKVSSVFDFADTEIAAARKSGFSPDFSLVLLAIAKKSGAGMDKIMALRNKKGYSWKDMCDEYNIDYYALMDDVEKKLIDNKLVPPPATSSERKKTAASNRRIKEGGKK